MRDKYFLLCVGCQKGGTSWLHDQVSKSKHVDLGFTKEYQVLESVYVPELRGLYERRLDRLETIIDNQIPFSKKHSNLLSHINFVIDPQKYYDYFDGLWHMNDQITTVGDFTPTYAGLPVSALTEIKGELESRGFRVKVIFTMRDPIERCWSAVRMRRRNFRSRFPDEVMPPEFQELRNTYPRKGPVIFTRYENTIENLEAVFDKRDIFYGLYETMFDTQSLRELDNFLELPDFAPDKNVQVNKSAKISEELPQELESEMRDFYRSTYEFCQERFSTDSIWNRQRVA